MYELKAKQKFSSGLEGTIMKGQTFTTESRDRAFWLQSQGLAEITKGDDLSGLDFETHEGAPSGSSSAVVSPDRAPRRKTGFDKPSDSGSTPSPSTTDGSSSPGPEPSTPPISNGGKSTPKKSASSSRASGGRSGTKATRAAGASKGSGSSKDGTGSA